MFFKRVSNITNPSRTVPTSYTIISQDQNQQSRSYHQISQKVHLSTHGQRRLPSSNQFPLPFSSQTNPMASNDSSPTSSISTSPASTVLSTPSSSVSSLSPMRMSTSSKHIFLPSGRHSTGVNTDSMGDTTSLENSFKIASFDTIRSYAQNYYAVAEQPHETEDIPRPSARGYQLLREPSWNKGEEYLQ